MSKRDRMQAIDALHDLLDAERGALLIGDIDQIQRLVAQKSDLVAQLAADSGPGDNNLGNLRKKLSRNHTLLLRAQQGIRSVTEKIAVLQRVRSSLETYDQSGELRSVKMINTGAVERRS
ncbi:MAG: flagellar biosynthesis protein FlgN [Sulfitobacter sp.]